MITKKLRSYNNAIVTFEKNTNKKAFRNVFYYKFGYSIIRNTFHKYFNNIGMDKIYN